MEQHERKDGSFVTSATASSSNITNSNYPGTPKRSLLDESTGTARPSSRSSQRLSESVLQEAREKIAQAEEDRNQSKLPKRLIPLVEMIPVQSNFHRIGRLVEMIPVQSNFHRIGRGMRRHGCKAHTHLPCHDCSHCIVGLTPFSRRREDSMKSMRTHPCLCPASSYILP